MPILTFTGDFIISQFDLEEDDGEIEVEYSEKPFLSKDIIRIEIDDRDVGPTGEFDPDLVRFKSFTVERDGTIYEFGVDSGSKIKESGGGSAKEQGDTYFVTNDSVTPPASGPFSGLQQQTYLFSSETSFANGSGEANLRKHSSGEQGGGDGNFNIQSSQVCFAEGTKILTPSGEAPVEKLKVGDLLTTLDHGPQPVRLVQHSAHRWTAFPDKDKPILIAAGALGAGLPIRPLRVSPQHRILVPNQDGSGTVLVPAHALCVLHGIRRMNGLRAVRYFHLMMDRHEILFADDLPTESFFPGPVALRSLSAHQHRSVHHVMQNSLYCGGANAYRPARPMARASNVRKTLASQPELWTETRLTQERETSFLSAKAA